MDRKVEEYLEAMLASIAFLTKIDKREKKSMASQDAIRDFYCLIHEYRDNFEYKKYKEHVKEVAESVIDILPIDNVRSRCHIISNIVLKEISANFDDDFGRVTLTLGDVSYDGEKFFNTSKQYVKRLVAGGDSEKNSLNLHAWLTLGDLTILDPTILVSPTYACRSGNQVPSEHRVLFGHPSSFDNLQYHPMLIDNDFIQRIGEDKLRPS